MNTYRPVLASLLIVAWLLNGCASPTATPAPAATAPPAGADSATVGDLAGKVNGRPQPAAPLAPVSVGFHLQTGGEVRTGDASRARLDFADGTIMRLAANSAFTLQSNAPANDGSLAAKIQLTAGKLWVSLFGGELQVETPLGVASVRGSFAVFTYSPANDLLVVDCLEGTCSASNGIDTEQLGNLERVVLSRQSSLRQTLTAQDVEAFLQDNPESSRIVATLTAAPPEHDTPIPSLTPTLPAVAASATPSATSTSTPEVTAPAGTALPQPTVALIGFHVVQRGDTLFCLGRGYGVIPDAIAAANNLNPAAPLQAGARLGIPAVRWADISPGPVCPPQFQSPYPGLPAASATLPLAGARSATPLPACPTGMYFDLTMNLCRAIPLSATPAPPSATPAPTATPDAQGPTIANLVASPSQIGLKVCDITFSADLSDPAGVASASVIWISTPMSGTASNGTLVMQAGAGLTWSSAPLPIHFGTPATGTVTWSITTSDGLGNLNTAAGPAVTTAPRGSCP